MEGKMEFIVFCIENIADHFHADAADIYDFLARRTDILKKYIVPGYDVLHTQGKEYIVNDIAAVMLEEGFGT